MPEMLSGGLTVGFFGDIQVEFTVNKILPTKEKRIAWCMVKYKVVQPSPS